MKTRLEDIADETKFHSFILIQTDEKQVAEKWNYYVLSSNDQLLMATQQHKEKHEYNLSIQAINYNINNRNLILAQGNWLKQNLTPEQLSLFTKKTTNVLKFDKLKINNSIRFFYYLGLSNYGDKFIPITPVYLCENDCLIFQSSNILNDMLSFKTIQIGIDSQAFRNQKQQDNIFSFRSEYALLSDLHFLNCLVRSKKNIGSYIKNINYGQYVFWIHPEILQIVRQLYPYANL